MATDNESPAARMQRSGLTVDQLREIVAGASRPEFTKRAREAGLSIAEIKGIIDESTDTNVGKGSIGTSVTPIGGTPPAGGASTQD
jgi:hypothetical protein